MHNNLLHTIKLQQQASDPSNSAWVFASAGSGKTKILTDRVLRLLLEDVAPHKILCLTFTKVAAAEMQSRINGELGQWILLNDEKLTKKLHDLNGKIPSEKTLKKARTLFIKILDGDSKIKAQTIHSLCQTLIKIFPFEAGIKPNFEVLEGRQEKLLLQQAQKEISKKALSDESLRNLVSKINAKLHDKTFTDLLSELLSKKEKLKFLTEKFFGIEGLITEIFKNFSLSPSSTIEEICTEFFLQLNQKEVLNLALDLENTGLVKNKKIAANIRNFLEQPTLENFLNYQDAFFTKENEPRKLGKEVENNQHLSALAYEQQKLIFQFFDKINSHKICHNSALLLRFVDRILETYSELKKQKAVLDYNDLILESNRLLANPDFSEWIKMKMDGNFDHILVDESQDTNHQQWNIIKALSEDFFSGIGATDQNRSIFIVGDEKQSIYKFQGAEPNISSEIFSYFEEKLESKLQKIELNNSFRSLSKILEAVDKIFSHPERKNAISKISEFQEHKPIRNGLGKVEIWPKITKKKEEKKEKNYEWKIDFSQKSEEENYEEKEILAKIIASKIRNRIDKKEFLQDGTRPLEYSDFMILLRNRTNGFLENLVKTFHQYQIPFSSISKIKFSESLIIQDLLAAAKFALLTADDLNLACLLKSPFFAISEEDLFEICNLRNRDGSTIYKAIAQFDKFREICNDLELIIEKSQQLDVFEFFCFLLNHKNNEEKIVARFGDEALQIVDRFKLDIYEFSQNFSPNLQKFLEFVEKIDPEISLADEKSNRVKITTIHSAKGLQAPIVMIPDCSYHFGKLLSSREEISWVNFSNNDSADIFPLWCSKKAEENLFLKKHRHDKLIEAKEEYLRLFYVAITRAADELYIGGYGDANDPESWYEITKNSLADLGCLVSENEFFIEETAKLTQEKPAENVEVIFKNSAPKIISAKPSTIEINQGQIKGKLIHKILEILGKNYREEKSWLLNLVKKIIEKEEFLSKKEKTAISHEITEFMGSELFEKIFNGDVKCEIEIGDSVNNKKVLSRIDLLIEKEDEVLIIDYKSDETLPAAVPQQYENQLRNYKNLVQKIYPQKKISCAILWVKFLKLEICCF
jgi:ATP-dependent helicase/nuclease subunit A